MTRWLLDTNVLSELRKPLPQTSVVDFVAAQKLESLFVSSVAFAEIRFGIEMVPDPSKRNELKDWLEQKLRPMFAERILPVNEDVIFRWRLLVEQGRKAGDTYSQPDLFLAATSLQYGSTLVTRNVVDFAGTGAKLFNPWQ